MPKSRAALDAYVTLRNIASELDNLKHRFRKPFGDPEISARSTSEALDLKLVFMDESNRGYREDARPTSTELGRMGEAIYRKFDALYDDLHLYAHDILEANPDVEK